MGESDPGGEPDTGQKVRDLLELLEESEDDELVTVLDLITSKVGPGDLDSLDTDTRDSLRNRLSGVPGKVRTEETERLLAALEGDGESPAEPSSGEAAEDAEDLDRLMVLDEFRAHSETLGLSGTVTLHCFDHERSGLFVSQLIYARLLEPTRVTILGRDGCPCLEGLTDLPRMDRFIEGDILRISDDPVGNGTEVIDAVRDADSDGTGAVFVCVTGQPPVGEDIPGDVFLVTGSASTETPQGEGPRVALRDGDEADQITALITRPGDDGPRSIRYRYGLVDGLYKPIGDGVPEDGDACEECGEPVPDTPDDSETVICRDCAKQRLSGGTGGTEPEPANTGLLGGGTAGTEDTGNRLI